MFLKKDLKGFSRKFIKNFWDDTISGGTDIFAFLSGGEGEGTKIQFLVGEGSEKFYDFQINHLSLFQLAGRPQTRDVYFSESF